MSHAQKRLKALLSAWDQVKSSALSHKKFRVDAPHPMGRYKEETGGLLSQVEDF